MNPIVSSELDDIVDIDEHRLHLTSVKFDHPKTEKICQSRDFTFRLVYLQAFLLDLRHWGVKS